MRRALAVMAMLGAPVVLTAQISRTDFARGAEIRTEGGRSLYRVVLPDDVYDTSTRADLGDMRVLNAAGETVPHTLRQVPRAAGSEADWRAVPSFAMTEAQSGLAARTHVKIGADGAVLEVTNDRAPGRATTAYLVDASALKESLARMALAWETAPGTTFLAPVSVSASDDLNSWRTVVASSALAQLRQESYMLTQNEIELPPAGERARYFRISWPKELSPVTLKSVRVRPRTSLPQREIRWRTLSAAHVDPPNTAEYETRAYLPIEYVDVEFVDPTDAASVTIRSRPDASSPWSMRHSGLFYALQGPNGSIRSASARIYETTERQWRIETTREGGWRNRAPRLKVGWHPHELLFVAQGAAPYTLAYGSGRVGPVDAPVDQLLATLNQESRAAQVGEAKSGEPRTLGGADALEPGPTPLPWKQIVLWGVLVIAVGALALLAVRLFRDTKQEAA